ncbi:MAG: hypothetical protein GVY18_13560 [Bacteroidetes bacterium]|jgi:DNA-binding GntR family transcriptional regulator|nr:hypothetical protein [Bacteroidota bacterium]
MSESDGTVRELHLDDQTLARAVRHHRRAIAALEGAVYANLCARIRQAVLARLRADLLAFEAAMSRRGLPLAAWVDEVTD